LKRRAFTFQDQSGSTALSSDWNPLHIDPLAARRTMFGRIVVHGIHLALWGTDVWLDGRTECLALRSFRAIFQSRIGLDEEVRCARLPRLPADQTATLLPATTLDRAPIVLRHLRHFSDLAEGSPLATGT
jgi:MaoC dehydratase-like protein